MSRPGQLLSLLKKGITVLLIYGLFLAAAASLPTIGLLAWALFSPASPPACYQDASAPAPGGRYVATAVSCHTTEYIGGTGAWNEVEVCASPPDGTCRTVYAANGRPIIGWADGTNLAITVDGGGHLLVSSSLHSALGATISYEIAGQRSEEGFRKEMDDYARKLTMQTGPEFINEWKGANWKGFYAVQAWAQANAAYARQRGSAIAL